MPILVLSVQLEGVPTKRCRVLSPQLSKAAAAVCATVLLSLGQTAVAASSYTATLLPSLIGLGEEASAWGVNAHGEVVGGSMSLEPSYLATRWSIAGTPRTLEPFGNPFITRSVAFGINGAGDAVGLDSDGRALLWHGAGVTALPSLGGSDSAATAINNSGRIAGYSSTAGNATTHATVWQDGRVVDLGTLGGSYSYARAINDAGQVVGYSNTVGSDHSVAALWSDGSVQNLGTLGGVGSVGAGINDAGQVVGYNFSSTGSTRAIIWNGTDASFLGLLGPTWDYSQALDINNSAQTVGFSTSTSGYSHATLWAGDAATDLNRFLDPTLASAGWQLLRANAINESGLITGLAFNYNTARGTGFLLSPIPAVPEPGGLLLFAAGLCVIGARHLAQRGRPSAAMG